MKLNGFAVALMIVRPALFASVVVSLENCLAPFFVFGLSARDVILMGLVNVVFVLCFLCALGLFVRCRMGQFDTSHRTVFSLSAFLFVLRHWAVTLRTWNSYLHAIVTHALGVSLFPVVGESISTNKTSYTDAASRSIYSSCARYTSTSRWQSEFTYLWRGLPAFWTWRKVFGIASRTNSIISRVITAYLASVFHIANIPQVAY